MKIFSILIIFSTISAIAREPITGSRFEHLSGKKLRSTPQKFWNQKYQSSKFIYGKTPVNFLADNLDILKAKSKVLDMGMAEGRNAVFLARKGHDVTGVDISSVAVKKANILASEFGVKINGVVASLEKYVVQPNSYDVLLSFYYLDKTLIKKMTNWLKPGGFIFIESYTTKAKMSMTEQEISENTFVRPQELLTLFKGFKVIKYSEPISGEKFIASALLQKPTK